MLPVLKALEDGAKAQISQIRERVATAVGLSTDDLRERIPSGSQTTFVNRVSWAVTYMERAGLLERPRRGVCRLTSQGRQLLSRKPACVDLRLLKEYSSYLQWKGADPSPPRDDETPRTTAYEVETPEEALERAARQLTAGLETDVLRRVRAASPDFLEQVTVDLLIAMGYGGGDRAMGLVTGRTGDGGIDGTIKEDKLGLDEIYVQAKKYAASGSVGAGDLRNFAGAIDAAGTTKGVFVTTASFTSAARDYIERSPKRIVLIDGDELARLMVRHGIGVRTRDVYEIKRIDEDYFDEDAG